jgi:hypothetical protein
VHTNERVRVRAVRVGTPRCVSENVELPADRLIACDRSGSVVSEYGASVIRFRLLPLS